MLERFNKARICCPVEFFEEKIAVFPMKKSQIDPKMTKIPKFSNFHRFYVFSKFLTVDWTVEKGQQGENVLSSGLFRRVYCSFSSENVSN